MAFLVFEGIDGAGKSTLLKLLQSDLQDLGCEVIATREPGGTELGEELRQILIRKQGEVPCPRTELLLYMAGRAQHVDKKIRPALQAKKWVLSDRYAASSVAFQAGGREILESEVDALNAFATQALSPDLTVLIDLDIQTAQKRMKDREKDRFEEEKSEFHQRVRQKYLQLAENPSWLVLDANHSPQELYQILVSELKERALWPKS